MPQQTLSPNCYPCLFQQVLSLTELSQLSDAQKKSVFEKCMVYLLKAKDKNIAVQHVIRYATDTVMQELGQAHDYDPYRLIKTKSNQIAETFYSEFEAMIEQSQSPLETAIKIAAAGNIIDFGAKNHADINIEDELKTIDERGFGIYHYDTIAAQLTTANTLLYICDNAGEIVLDKILITQLKKQYPNLSITCAVRDKPIINDATMEDAQAIKLNEIASVISSGSIYPGTILDETSSQFQSHFNQSDIIIAKGQGNFETLFNANKTNLFFILRIKCNMMATLSKTEKGNLVLMQCSKRYAT